MGHHHDHHHSSNNIKVAFFLNFAFTILEIIGGLYVNSIAIISDAIHDLGDTISLGTSWYLEEKSYKKSNKKFSFGYKRFSLLGALINSIILIIGSLYVITEAVGRILEPEHTDAKGMIFFAVIGVLVNGYAAWKLSSGKTMNEKVASWHLVEDVLGWVAVLVVGIILNFKDIHYLDPALSLLITIYILWNVFIRLKQTLFIFLQGVPEDLDINEIESNPDNYSFVMDINNGMDATGYPVKMRLFKAKSIKIGPMLFRDINVLGINFKTVHQHIDPGISVIIGYNIITKANWHFDLASNKWLIE